MQVVIDNRPPNIVAKNMSKGKCPNIFWSSYVVYTIDFILEGTENLPKYKAVIEKAIAIIVFLYAYHNTFALVLSFTSRREFV